MENIGILVSSLNSGGAERAAANLSRDLSDKYNVFLLVFDSSNICYPYKGTLVDLHYSNNGTLVSRAYNAIKLILRLRYVKKKYKLAVVISFMPGANKYNVLSKTKTKSIVSIRNTMSRKKLSEREKRSIVSIGKKADLTVSLSDGTRSDLIENFDYDPSSVITIYNSCDSSWFRGENEEIRKAIDSFDFSKPTIVTVGRLHDQKGQWHLLRSFSIIKKEIPTAKLVIFGDGELKEKLVEYSKELGIESNTYFMGYVMNHHLFMEKCDVFAFSSLYEGLGNVLLEAIACGMVVVSTDCMYGPREILCPELSANITSCYYGEYGVLIPPFDDSCFDGKKDEFEASDIYMAEAIIRLLKDRDQLNHYRERAIIRSQAFLPSEIKNQWYECINKVLRINGDN